MLKSISLSAALFVGAGTSVAVAAPGGVSDTQLTCLKSNLQNNLNTIEACGISDAQLRSAIYLIGTMHGRDRFDLIDSPWTNKYCAPRRISFECTYHGVTVIFKPEGDGTLSPRAR